MFMIAKLLYTTCEKKTPVLLHFPVYVGLGPQSCSLGVKAVVLNAHPYIITSTLTRWSSMVIGTVNQYGSAGKVYFQQMSDALMCL